MATANPMIPTPKMRTGGSEEAMYRGFALQQLAILRQQMKLGGLKEGKRRLKLDGGAELLVTISYGHEQMFVRVPHIGKEDGAETIMAITVELPVMWRNVAGWYHGGTWWLAPNFVGGWEPVAGCGNPESSVFSRHRRAGKPLLKTKSSQSVLDYIGPMYWLDGSGTICLEWLKAYRYYPLGLYSRTFTGSSPYNNALSSSLKLHTTTFGKVSVDTWPNRVITAGIIWDTLAGLDGNGFTVVLHLTNSTSSLNTRPGGIYYLHSSKLRHDALTPSDQLVQAQGPAVENDNLNSAFAMGGTELSYIYNSPGLTAFGRAYTGDVDEYGTLTTIALNVAADPVTGDRFVTYTKQSAQAAVYQSENPDWTQAVDQGTTESFSGWTHKTKYLLDVDYIGSTRVFSSIKHHVYRSLELDGVFYATREITTLESDGVAVTLYDNYTTSTAGTVYCRRALPVLYDLRTVNKFVGIAYLYSNSNTVDSDKYVNRVGRGMVSWGGVPPAEAVEESAPLPSGYIAANPPTTIFDYETETVGTTVAFSSTSPLPQLPHDWIDWQTYWARQSISEIKWPPFAPLDYDAPIQSVVIPAATAEATLAIVSWPYGQNRVLNWSSRADVFDYNTTLPSTYYLVNYAAYPSPPDYTAYFDDTHTLNYGAAFGFGTMESLKTVQQE